MTDQTTPPDAHDSAPERLPCGRDPLDVVDRARAGRGTDHEKTCAHCQAIIAADAPTGRAVPGLADTEAAIGVPDTLLPGVMHTVWSQLRRDTLIPLPTDNGSAFVADHTVAAVVESALDDSTGLQVHTCTVALNPDATAPDPSSSYPSPAGADVDQPAPARPRIDIGVTAAAAYGSDVHDTARHARGVVHDVIATQFGWHVDTIDIDIVDVYLRPGAAT